MLQVLSRSNNVIPAPRTGKVKMSRTEAVNMHQVSRHERTEYMPVSLDMNAVTMNVAAPPSDDAPMTCKASIAIFMADEEENLASDRGGYRVHPALSPSSRATDKTTS